MNHRGAMIITGSRKGIGRFLAEHYLKQGFHVAGCSREPTDLQADNYLHQCLDVRDEKAVCEFLAAVRSRWGALGVLINNAGIAAMNHALLTPLHTVRQVLEINVLGTFLFCREAAKSLRSTPHARIVNFSTVAVPLNLAGEAAYAASKAAVETLTRVLARELAPLKITCNAVGPTPVATDLIRGVASQQIERLVAGQPIPRMGQPDDVANVVDFFLRPESDFITGQVIYLGGIS
jgi:3-oxoacyl-[acyl-carrier protein] reductase